MTRNKVRVLQSHLPVPSVTTSLSSPQRHPLCVCPCNHCMPGPLKMTNYPGLANCSNCLLLFSYPACLDPVQMTTAVGRRPEDIRLPLTTHNFCKADFLENGAWRSPAAWRASLELLWRLFCKKETQPAAIMISQSCCSPALQLSSLQGMPLAGTNPLSGRILNQKYLLAQAST